MTIRCGSEFQEEAVVGILNAYGNSLHLNFDGKSPAKLQSAHKDNEVIWKLLRSRGKEVELLAGTEEKNVPKSYHRLRKPDARS
jgi:hypothetical protein